MVHADAGKFADGISKAQMYDQVISNAKALFDGQRNWVCNTANTSALLYQGLRSLGSGAPSAHVNWAGFYVTVVSDSSLVLGPFQGGVACQEIAFGRGVCGTAAKEVRAVVVPDVDEFPGHIACDSASKSEVVVPIVHQNKVVAIIDIDCAVVNGFDKVDEEKLVQLASLLSHSCDWP